MGVAQSLGIWIKMPNHYWLFHVKTVCSTVSFENVNGHFFLLAFIWTLPSRFQIKYRLANATFNSCVKFPCKKRKTWKISRQWLLLFTIRCPALTFWTFLMTSLLFVFTSITYHIEIVLSDMLNQSRSQAKSELNKMEMYIKLHL